MADTDVFISYRREDRPKVALIAERLQALDLTVWFDAHLESGMTFDEETTRHLEDCKAVLVCWTPDAIKSRWVRAEASFGLDRDILAAVMLEPTRLVPPYNLVQAADLAGWNGESNAEWASLIGRIGKLVGRPALAEEAAARALAARWQVHDDAARNDYLAQLGTARLRFEALQRARPEDFERRVQAMNAAFEAWLKRRRESGGSQTGAVPDPMSLIDDTVDTLRRDLETMRRERDAAANALGRQQQAGAQTGAPGAAAATEPAGPGRWRWYDFFGALLFGPFYLMARREIAAGILGVALYAVTYLSPTLFDCGLSQACLNRMAKALQSPSPSILLWALVLTNLACALFSPWLLGAPSRRDGPRLKFD